MTEKSSSKEMKKKDNRKPKKYTPLKPLTYNAEVFSEEVSKVLSEAEFVLLSSRDNNWDDSQIEHLEKAYEILKRLLEKGDKNALIPYIKIAAPLHTLYGSFGEEPYETLTKLSLDSLKKQELDDIINLFKSDDHFTKYFSMRCLGSLGDKRVAEPFLEELKKIDIESEGFFSVCFVEVLYDYDIIEEFVDMFKDFGNDYIWIIHTILTVDELKTCMTARFLPRVIVKLRDDLKALTEICYTIFVEYEYSQLAKYASGAIDNFKQALNDPKLREKAEIILKMVEPQGDVSLLIKSLDNEDSRIRTSAIDALKELGDSRAIEPIIRLLKNKVSSGKNNEEKESKEKISAIAALVKFDDSRAEKLIISVLIDEDHYLREKVASFLPERIAEQVKDALLGLAVKDIKLAKTLVQKGELRAIKHFLNLCYEKRDKKTEVSEPFDEMFDKLMNLGKDNLEPFIKILDDWRADMGIHQFAERVVEQVKDALLDLAVKDIKVAKTLVQKGELRAIKPFLDICVNCTNNWGANEPFDEMLDKLVNIGKENLEPFLEILDDGWDDVGTHHFVSLVLIKIGEPIVDPLIEILKDRTRLASRKVTNILTEIGNPRAIEPLIETLKFGDGILFPQSWRRFGGKAVEPLIKALRDENENVRASAAWFLGERVKTNDSWDKQAVEPLIESLRDKDDCVRRMAAKSLNNFWDKRAVEPFIESLRDENYNVRKAAVVALGKLGDARAIEPLKLVLGSEEDKEIRILTEESLRKVEYEETKRKRREGINI